MLHHRAGQLILVYFLFTSHVSARSFTTSTSSTSHESSQSLLPRAIPSIIPSRTGSPQFATTVSAPLATITSNLDNVTRDCELVDYIISLCISESPGFTTYPPTSQASCICYVSSTVWRPRFFDAPVSSCASHLLTASRRVYPVVSSLIDFCVNAGDVKKSETGSESTSTRSTRRTDQSSEPSSALSTIAATPSPSSGSPPGSGGGLPPPKGIQDFTRAQVVGICVGCSCVGVIAFYALWVGCRRKRLSTPEAVTEDATHVGKMPSDHVYPPEIGFQGSAILTRENLGRESGIIAVY